MAHLCWPSGNALQQRCSLGPPSRCAPVLGHLPPTSAAPPPAAPACSEAGLRQLASAPIRTLLASACCQLTDGCLAAIAGGMPRLACLGLFEAGEEVTDAGLAHLARLRGGLTALDMGYSTWSHTPAGLQQLLAQLTGLRLLNIGAPGSSAAAPACLPVCSPPGLPRASGGPCTPAVRAPVSAAGGRSARLCTAPPAGGCEGTTDAVVATVAQHCRQLTQLDVSESQRVTAAGVGQLSKVRAARVGGWGAHAGARSAEPLVSAPKSGCAGLRLPASSGPGVRGQLLRASCPFPACCGLDPGAPLIKVFEVPRKPALHWPVPRRRPSPLNPPPHPPCLQLPALLELNLGWNIRLRDSWLEGLPPSLSRLDLSFCGELTDGALRHLGARLPGLASVTLRKCGRITEAVRAPCVLAAGAREASCTLPRLPAATMRVPTATCKHPPGLACSELPTPMRPSPRPPPHPNPNARRRACHTCRPAQRSPTWTCRTASTSRGWRPCARCAPWPRWCLWTPAARCTRPAWRSWPSCRLCGRWRSAASGWTTAACRWGAARACGSAREGAACCGPGFQSPAGACMERTAASARGGAGLVPTSTPHRVPAAMCPNVAGAEPRLPADLPRPQLLPARH